MKNKILTLRTSVHLLQGIHAVVAQKQIPPQGFEQFSQGKFS